MVLAESDAKASVLLRTCRTQRLGRRNRTSPAVIPTSAHIAAKRQHHISAVSTTGSTQHDIDFATAGNNGRPKSKYRSTMPRWGRTCSRRWSDHLRCRTSQRHTVCTRPTWEGSTAQEDRDTPCHWACPAGTCFLMVHSHNAAEIRNLNTVMPSIPIKEGACTHSSAWCQEGQKRCASRQTSIFK
jgi:hypothetical protein